MKSVDKMVESSVVEHTKEILSEKDIKNFKKDIISLFGAIACLLSGIIYSKVYINQDVVCALIYFFGILIIGIPILITAIKGLIAKDMKSSMEILVSMAMIIATLDGQFTLAILIPIILTFVHFLEEKSIMGGRDAINSLKKMQSENAILYVDGKEKIVNTKSLKIEDIIIVKPGMALPVDGEVIKGVTSIDQKSFTGESVPKLVSVSDIVYAGTINIDGVIYVKVTKEYKDTSFQKIVKLLENSENISIPETKIVDKFMSFYIPLTLMITFLVWLYTQNINRAIAVLVVSCPCGHMLINSAPVIASLSNASRKGIMIKNSAFVEKLSRCDYVIFDKTGTITNGILEIENYTLNHAHNFDELITTAGEVSYASLHPISKSIMKLCKDKKISKEYTIKEYIGKGLEGIKNDSKIYVGHRKWIISLGFDIGQNFEDKGACDWVVKDGKVLGCLIFKDSPRENAKYIINKLKQIGVENTCLLTGDSYVAAKRIQDNVKIDDMRCELTPEEKLEYVENMINKNHTVAVIGDGINDALALSKASVGIAMGAMGSNTAIQSADIALMNNDLNNIPYAIRLSKLTKDIVYQNIILSFSISFLMIILASIGIVTPIAGALLHNIGAFAVLINSGRLLKRLNF